MTFKIGLKILSKKEQKMTTELALNTIDSTLSIWNDNEHLQEIRKLFAPTLSDIEFKIYVGMGKATGLNPFLKEIWAIKFGKDKDGKELPAQIFIGRDGYRKGAQSHPEYDFHQSDAVYENDKFDVNKPPADSISHNKQFLGDLGNRKFQIRFYTHRSCIFYATNLLDFVTQTTQNF